MVRLKHFLIPFIALLALVSNVFASVKLDGVIPLVMYPPATAAPGETVQFYIVLSGPAEGNEVIDVDVTAGAFTSIPSSVTPEAGDDYVTVTGTLSQNPGSLIQVEASSGEASVGTHMILFRTPPKL